MMATEKLTSQNWWRYSMDVTGYLPIEQSKNAENVKDGDYQKDGLWYCGVCHRPKQHRIELGSFKRIVWCICQCDADRLQERKEKDDYEERMRYVQRLKMASCMPRDCMEASFSEYRVRKENEKAFNIAKRYVERFGTMKQEAQGLLLYGPLGTGKSYTAACIANALMEQSVPVIMTSFVEILKDIQGRGSKEAEYMDALNAATMLIIDDLGAERDSAYAVEKVYSVIDRRVRSGKPMILTTNLKVQDMVGCADLSLRRIYDRIFEKCYPVEMLGTSFRLEEAARRQAQMKMLFA